MLLKLSDNGLIEIVPYKGCKLTPLGLEACKDIVRIHRLWEVFLVRYLKFTWREAHEDAHVLEHATTARIAERLNEFLNYPEICPHGSSIPQKNHIAYENHTLIALNSLNVGIEAIVSKVMEDGELLDYLWDKGLKIGAKVSIIAKDSYEGPIVLSQDGQEIIISYKAATQIYVER